MATSWYATAGALRGMTCPACLSRQKRWFAICPLRPCLHKGTVYYRVPNPYIPVLLLRSVRGLGVRGQLVQTRRGTLRNFLLPQKLAVVATWQNIDRNHLLAQEATKSGPQKSVEKSVDSVEPFLSVPAGVFECVSSAATKVSSAFGEGYLARLSSNVVEQKRETYSVYKKHSAEGSGGVSTLDPIHPRPHTVQKADELQVHAETPPKGEKTEKQGSVTSESAEGLFGFPKGYCARFVVDTDRSNPSMVRGKGISVYDILKKLSEEVQLDLLPQQANLTITQAREESVSEYTRKTVPWKPEQENLSGGSDLAGRVWSNFDSKRAGTREETVEGIDHDQVLRTCGPYQARVSIPLRHGAVANREFSILLVSKQEITRLLKAKRLHQEVEALRTDFSLGPDS